MSESLSASPNSPAMAFFFARGCTLTAKVAEAQLDVPAFEVRASLQVKHEAARDVKRLDERHGDRADDRSREPGLARAELPLSPRLEQRVDRRLHRDEERHRERDRNREDDLDVREEECEPHRGAVRIAVPYIGPPLNENVNENVLVKTAGEPCEQIMLIGRSNASAMGDRQVFPVQTKRITGTTIVESEEGRV